MAFMVKSDDVVGKDSKPEVGQLVGMAIGEDFVGNSDVQVSVPEGYVALVVKVLDASVPWSGGNSPGLKREITCNVGTAARVADSKGKEVALRPGYTLKVALEVFETRDRSN